MTSTRGLDADLSALRAALDRLTAAGDSANEAPQRARIEAVRALEDVKDAACAAQAELAVTVVAAEVALADAVSDDADRDAECSTRARARRTARARRSAIAQVALARRESPHRAGVLVGMAEALVREMPHTLAALQDGVLNEFRAAVLVRETACLERAARAEVDEAICGDSRSLDGIGTRRLVAAAKAEAYRLDPHSIVRRAERDAKERCVTLRPAPGSMTYLTALVPMAQGVAMLANLRRTADSARATGDERSRGQLMADTLAERVTGQASADAVPVMVNLVMSDASLLAAGHEPAVLDGANPMPAQLARELVARAMAVDDPTGDAREGGPQVARGDRRREARTIGAWVRRLYADAGGNLVAMDSRARTFPAGLAALLRIRDQGLCRTPWCDAPIAHADHVLPVADGGRTSASNGQGLCAGCNYTKQAPGWGHEVEPSGERHTVVTQAPTGHRHISRAPAPPVPLRDRGRDAGRDVEPWVDDCIEIVRPRPGESPLELALARAA